LSRSAQPIDKKKTLILKRHYLNFKQTMMKKVLLGLTLLVVLSCNKDDGDALIKQESGKVWLSGGLAYCAEQIRLDNGVTLIVNIKDIISFKSGDRVTVKYKEIGINEFCSPSIDCEIIEIH
jgi:hypothetical protein